MTFRLLPPAALEIKEAANFYEHRVPGLGFDFIAEVRAAIRLILNHPQAWHRAMAQVDGVRRTDHADRVRLVES